MKAKKSHKPNYRKGKGGNLMKPKSPNKVKEQENEKEI